MNFGSIIGRAADADAALGYFALDRERRSFSIGHAERRVTMHTQQLRAINLAAALITSGQVTRSSRVAIVGGGLAGMTLATALTTAGASIALIERTNDLMNVQSGCHTRYIHPNVFDWPAPHAFANVTTLPFLNWRAGPADSVTRQVRSAFESFRPLIDVRLGRSVVGEVAADRTIMTAATFASDPAVLAERFDVVVLAVGFGVEKSLLGVPVRSYWHDEALHQIDRRAERRRSLAVVGAGDGGVTDVLRLVLQRFDHGEVLTRIGHHPDVVALGRDMIGIEDDARRRGTGAGAFLAAEYAALDVPPILKDAILSAVREDVSVTLFESARSPFQLSASILNRLLLLAALRLGRLHFEPRGLAEGDEAGFDLIVPRIGPEDVLTPLLGAGMSVLAHDPMLSVALAGAQMFPPTLFRQNTTPRPQMRVGLIHNIADRHNRDLVDRIRIEVREHNQRGRGAFILMHEARIDVAHILDPSMRIEDELGHEVLDVLIIPNSDLALHADRLARRARRLILCCEATTINEVSGSLEHLGAGNLLLVPQILDLAFMVKAIKSGFGGLRLCYVHHPSFPIDALYLHVLEKGLADQGDGLGGVEVIEHVCAPDGFGALPPADVYSGRHFVHACAPRSFIGSIPYLSGYAADLERGALAALDINDDESGRRLVRDDLLPLALGYAPPERIIPISDMSLGLNLAQARRFGIDIPDALRDLATTLLEE